MHAFPYSPAATALLLRHKSPTASFPNSTTKSHLSVGLLVPGTGTRTTELLGLHTAVVSDEEGTVVGDESLLELVLAVLVDVLLVVGDLVSSVSGPDPAIDESEVAAVGNIQCSWRSPDGWRRPGRCDHHHGRAL